MLFKNRSFKDTRLPRSAIGLAVTVAMLVSAQRDAFAAQSVASRPNAPDACSAVSGFNHTVDRTDFCVYYTDGTTDAQATTVADHVQNYWNHYATDLGFRAPSHSGKLQVLIDDVADCNGSTSAGTNAIRVNQGCFSIAESIQQATGHELFHRVQYSYDGSEVRWFKEGTARAMEDLAFTNIDHWVNALAAPFNFNKQANIYLNNTNEDITSDPQRYNSALWWKYFTEQFGTTATEPERGVDAMRRLWDAAATQNDVAALNTALSGLGGPNFDTAFRNFAAANWIKDLTNQPGSAFNYLDEDEAGNPAQYGPIFPTSGGVINLTTAATFNGQALSRYGARYFRATPSAADCPVVSAKFHATSGPAFFHIITQKGNALDTFSSSTAADYTRAFFNDGLTSIVAIAGSTNAAATADIKLECINPTIDIKLPNSTAIARVGSFDTPGKLLAQVLVTNGDPKGPVVAGLTVNDFKARINGQNALIAGGGFIQEQYWLVIEAPAQTANGTYDLEVKLEKSGTTTVLTSDTNPASVAYNPDHTDHILVLDRSGSMSIDNKMVAAQQAAKFYVDITRLNDGVAVVPFNSDVSPAPFSLRAVTAAPNVRQQAKDYIDAITASGSTSIGDGMAAGAAQRNASPTGNPACSYVLLSDGMENSPQFWANVRASVQATHCPVTSIAFGPESDETLMQAIATQTGGLFFYNDVFVSAGTHGPEQADAASDTNLNLGNSYEYAQARSDHRQRLQRTTGVMPLNTGASGTQTKTVLIDDSLKETLFALDWLPTQFLKAKLIQPNGTEFGPPQFIDYVSGHLGWRVAQPAAGVWQIVIDYETSCQVIVCIGAVGKLGAEGTQQGETPYQLIVSGQSNISLELLLPDRLNSHYFTGNRVPIYAIATSNHPITGLAPIAIVTAPNGQLSNVPLLDDGAHDDGAANDGLYGGIYTKVSQAAAVTPRGEIGTQPTPNNEGSYQVRLTAQNSTFNREALGSFSVPAGPDTNVNGLPDPYETENHVTQAEGDPDLDGLDSVSEFQIGTDPNTSDTDGGGENDGSEYAKGKDPFNPADDSIAAPQYLTAAPDTGETVVTYDARPEYNRMVLYRATAIGGPWQVREPELPASGVYTDTATNGQTYFYRFMAINANDNRSAVIASGPARPALDPFIPEATLEINNGAISTTNSGVTLQFAPLSQEPEDKVRFDDITEVKLSNDPALAGASYQPFSKSMPWQLGAPAAGGIARVYALLRDSAGNESLVLVDGISTGQSAQGGRRVFIPIISR